MFGFRRWCLLALSAASLLCVDAKSSTGDSVLVVVDPNNQDKYSLFFDGLKDSGYKLTFRSPKAEKPVVIADDVPNFDHVILLAPEARNLGKDITPQSIVQLLSLKTNVIVTLPTKQSPLHSLAAEFGLILPPPGSPLISYFPQRDTPSSLIPIPVEDHSSPALTKHIEPVWFSGIPQALSTNPLLIPILRAPAESFASETLVTSGSADALVESAEKGGEGLWAGSSLSAVTGFQATNGARIAFVGGAEVFSDELAQKEVAPYVKSGNADFSREVAAWTFQENLVLRIDGVEHHLAHENTTVAKEQYTNNDNVVFSAYVSKWDAKQGRWEPYSGLKDLQLEFTMLDPFIRTALPPVRATPGKYSTTFRAPDRHGVFKFIIDYKRKGWTSLQSSTTIPVVPPRHDGYPRFLSAAWPYYAGAISTSVAFLLFSTAWLAGEARDRSSRKAKGSKAE
ncbi:dolichyl-diphosphooligosaccharide-protein glycosyltransferase [Ephemerocybe angulata]|uniref:Dolichyl-diphosphooligosaccharide--protein glycosyltransferase subunit WBP1 n=1 Tax=Ephemerocybe angulata TaxID=980116 RepID=A0A8H6IFF5_9AGAR|nr:dolichyl-diphosphooligosaccharide-protein glycosyltransferase [Tulosesus angulatus]